MNAWRKPALTGISKKHFSAAHHIEHGHGDTRSAPADANSNDQREHAGSEPTIHRIDHRSDTAPGVRPRTDAQLYQASDWRRPPASAGHHIE